MEGLAPPLELLFCVKYSIEQGRSVKAGVLSYTAKTNDEFASVVTRWLGGFQQGINNVHVVSELSSLHRRVLLQVLERGLRGESIYGPLCQLEEELIEACREEIVLKIAKLPFYMMIPLLLFQFPAFLILLFGPLLQNFFTSFGGQ
jgi:hypothetical protein